nr:hypothetical protein [Acinetobacter sp. YH12073]
MLFGLVSASALANDLYALKDRDGNSILSSMENPNTEYRNLVVGKDTYTTKPKLEDWNLNCTKDRFSGTKSCTLNKSYDALSVGIYSGRHSVYVGRNHFPRTQSAIKIDNNSPIYGYEGSSNTPQRVIEQMKKGKVAYTRYKEWPYEYNQDGETDLTGFAEKYNEMLEEYKKL